jgi:hypothetical protein
MNVSVVVPPATRGAIEATVIGVVSAIEAAGRTYETVVVDDSSTDGTAGIVERLADNNPRVRHLRSPHTGGFGFAVHAELDVFEGDAVAGDRDGRRLRLAERSGALLRPARRARLRLRLRSAFPARRRGLRLPPVKLVINRVVNFGIRVLFGHDSCFWTR